MLEPSFAKSLFECDDASSLKLDGGNRFIRKLPDDRSLGYLHTLYSGVNDADLERMSASIGRELPEEFQSFLRWSNGATLFDSHVYVFGSVERLSRSVDPEKRQPISIESENRIFSATNSGRWHDGWTRVGAVVGWNTKFEIELNCDGTCAVWSNDGHFSARSFRQCLSTILDHILPCFSCDGITDKSYAEIEAALFNLTHAQ